MQVDNYLEFSEKLEGKVDGSARDASLDCIPEIALLFSALVQLPAWYLCISSNNHLHAATSIEQQKEMYACQSTGAIYSGIAIIHVK